MRRWGAWVYRQSLNIRTNIGASNVTVAFIDHELNWPIMNLIILNYIQITLIIMVQFSKTDSSLDKHALSQFVPEPMLSCIWLAQKKSLHSRITSWNVPCLSFKRAIVKYCISLRNALGSSNGGAFGNLVCSHPFYTLFLLPSPNSDNQPSSYIFEIVLIQDISTIIPVTGGLVSSIFINW